MINFEQYLLERKGSSAGQQVKRKVNIEQLKQMIANKDPKIADVDVGEITDMSELFKGSDFGGSWTADLSGWDTSNVENMSRMFKGCTSLKEVALPNTGNVENMNEMFEGCTSLIKVELPHTENVVSQFGMNGMFHSCTSLKEVSLPHTENITGMWGMFYGCKELEQNFSSWNVKGKTTTYMFDGCTKMEESYRKGNSLYPKGYEQ